MEDPELKNHAQDTFDSKQFLASDIQLLPPQLANQIAAGEVVERPASVVKELIENSLDANSDSIHIEIDQGGHKRILIRDSGDGIAKAQLELALSRHATSKIRDIDDLNSIRSMGFRGEALASISSVSRLTLSSKPQGQSQAWQAKAEGIDMDVLLSPTAHPKGTSIEVLDLFFNTPARRKFLRAQKTEMQHIENIVKRVALAHPSVSFVLKHNGKLIHKWSSSDLEARITAVCGRDFLAKTTYAQYKHESIQLSGWFSKIGEAWPNNERQFIFVNQRMIRDKLVLHAIRQAYEGMLPDSQHPAYVLFLNIPPEQLDINVHPAKHEVRFHQARQVHDIIFQAISQVILDAQCKTEGQTNSFERGSEGQYGASAELGETINHDYISPLRSSTDGNGLNLGSVRRQSIGSKEAGGSRFSNTGLPEAHNANIAEAGKRYQELMQSSGNADNERQNQGLQEQDYQASLPPFVQLGEHLIFQYGDRVLTINRCKIVSECLLHSLHSASTAQPLLMPVSLAQKPKEDHAAHTQQSAVLRYLTELGCSIVEQQQKYVLKQVPSALRSLPWTHIFVRLLEQAESVDSKHACVECISRHYLELVSLDHAQILAMLNKLPSKHFNDVITRHGTEVSEQAFAKLLET